MKGFKKLIILNYIISFLVKESSDYEEIKCFELVNNEKVESCELIEDQEVEMIECEPIIEDKKEESCEIIN